MTEEQRHFRLEAIDREVTFYRRRAGQVFFVGLTVEVFILAGRERIVVPAAWPWIQPLVYGLFFIAVAAVGILLGREYRDRIHVLKDTREKLSANGYPPTGGKTLSEIEMLYVVLVFLSSSGIVIVWLNALTTDKGKVWAVDNLSILFWVIFGIFILLGAMGNLWAVYKTLGWFSRLTSYRPIQTSTIVAGNRNNVGGGIMKKDLLDVYGKMAQHWASYHNHKEVSAWAGLALYFMFILVFLAADLPTNGRILAASGMTVAILIVLWPVTIYIKNQLELKDKGGALDGAAWKLLAEIARIPENVLIADTYLEVTDSDDPMAQSSHTHPKRLVDEADIINSRGRGHQDVTRRMIYCLLLISTLCSIGLIWLRALV